MVKLGGQEAVKKSISRIWREFNRANFCSESPINDVCDVGIHLRSLAKFAKPIFSQLPDGTFATQSRNKSTPITILLDKYVVFVVSSTNFPEGKRGILVFENKQLLAPGQTGRAFLLESNPAVTMWFPEAEF